MDVWGIGSGGAPIEGCGGAERNVHVDCLLKHHLPRAAELVSAGLQVLGGRVWGMVLGWEGSSSYTPCSGRVRVRMQVCGQLRNE